MTTSPELPRKPRLQEVEELSIEPFVRATALKDCAVYWLGVRTFPISVYERTWILEFLRRLAAHMKATAGLREETFLQAKALGPELMTMFQRRARTYTPVAGMTLIPGTTPVGLPDPEEMQKAVENAGQSKSKLDVHRWMPDHAHWFLHKDAEAERDDFFGHGGLFSLLLKPDPTAYPPLPPIPRIMRTHPAFSGGMESQYQQSQSLRDPFLARSKEVFGEPFHEDPSYDGLMFVLPLLTSAGLLETTGDERARWFTVFDGYWIESKPDKGLLVVLKDPLFDATMDTLLRRMRDDGFHFRSVG